MESLYSLREAYHLGQFSHYLLYTSVSSFAHSHNLQLEGKGKTLLKTQVFMILT